MKFPGAIGRLLRHWTLVTGTLVLAGHCPCCGRAGCATGLGTATALGGLLAGAGAVVRRLWSRWSFRSRSSQPAAHLQRELETLYPHP